MADGVFNLRFILKASASPEEAKTLGEAINSWYRARSGELTQYYIDGAEKGSKNFKGDELQELREGVVPESGFVSLTAYDGRPRFTREQYIKYLKQSIPSDLVEDVLVDDITWNNPSG